MSVSNYYVVSYVNKVHHLPYARPHYCLQHWRCAQRIRAEKKNCEWSTIWIHFLVEQLKTLGPSQKKRSFCARPWHTSNGTQLTEWKTFQNLSIYYVVGIRLFYLPPVRNKHKEFLPASQHHNPTIIYNIMIVSVCTDQDCIRPSAMLGLAGSMGEQCNLTSNDV